MQTYLNEIKKRLSSELQNSDLSFDKSVFDMTVELYARFATDLSRNEFEECNDRLLLYYRLILETISDEILIGPLALALGCSEGRPEGFGVVLVGAYELLMRKKKRAKLCYTAENMDAVRRLKDSVLLRDLEYVYIVDRNISRSDCDTNGIYLCDYRTESKLSDLNKKNEYALFNNVDRYFIEWIVDSDEERAEFWNSLKKTDENLQNENFSDSKYATVMKTSDECSPKQKGQMKNSVSFEQTTPIEFQDNIKAWVDEETNLMWEVKQEDNINKKFTWEEAKEWAKCLNSIKYGGFDDWRVPTRYELESLCNIHYGEYDDYNNDDWDSWNKKNKDKKNNGFYIKKPLSKNTCHAYWTSTLHKEFASFACKVHFDRGYTYWSGKTNNYCVRCVRSYL